MASQSSALLERAEAAAASANQALAARIAAVGLAISEHAFVIGISQDASKAKLELEALVAKLRSAYEELAAVLRAEAFEVPALRPANFKRNFFHVCSASFATGLIAMLGDSPGIIFAVAVGFATLSWSMELSRRVSPKINERLMHLFRHVSHPHEAHQINSSTWYATALLILAATFSPRLCLIGVAVLGLADPAAAIVGRRFGRLKLVNGRTLEGSLTFAVVGAATSLGLLLLLSGSALPDLTSGGAVWVALAAGVTGALAELFSRRVDDNFSIPLASAAGAWVALLLLG